MKKIWIFAVVSALLFSGCDFFDFLIGPEVRPLPVNKLIDFTDEMVVRVQGKCCLFEAGSVYPVAPAGVRIEGLDRLVISASGWAALDEGEEFGSGPDGDPGWLQTSPGDNSAREFGISAISSPAESLLGVFLCEDYPDTRRIPVDLTVTGEDDIVLTPELQQSFFIGSGPHTFTIPPGATRLYFGLNDGSHWENNVGEFAVQLFNGNSTSPRPVAEAGGNRQVTVGDQVHLDGSASHDPAGLPLSYNWHIASFPTGSLAVLSAPGEVAPSFTADVQGIYDIRLVVFNGREYSLEDSVTITASQGQTPADFEVLAVRSRDAYTVEVEFSRELNATSATNIGNYEITYRTYELQIQSAELDGTGRIVTLLTGNSQGQGENEYALYIDNLADTAGNILSERDGISFTGTIPDGVAEFGDPDNYRIFGQVVTESGIPLAGVRVEVASAGPDNYWGLNWGTDDDVRLCVLTDDNGEYQLNGLPVFEAFYFWSAQMEGYEESSDHFIDTLNIHGDFSSPYEMNVMKYPLVPGTEVSGNLVDVDGNVVTAVQDGQIRKVNWNGLSMLVHAFGIEDGYYELDNLAGGWYEMHLGEGDQGGYHYQIFNLYLEPGTATWRDCTMYRKTVNNILPVYLSSPGDGTAPASPLNFSWEHTEHVSVQSYALGIWSASCVNTAGDYPMPAGQPDMLYYIMPDTVTSAEVDTSTSPMTISGDNYRIVTNVRLTGSEDYYWGIFAFNSPYNNADANGQFSAEPVAGLWRFTAP